MSETRLAAPFPPYGPPSRRDRALTILSRPLTLKDLVLGLVGILVALGWTVTTPGKRIDKLEARVTHVEKTVDTLSEQQRFTNYMLCVNARRTDPASVPPDCAPVIEARKGK